MPLFGKGFLRGLDKSGEGLGIGDGDFGKHLTVDFDVRLLKSVHEDGIRDVVHAASGVDALDPELTIVALDEAAGIVSVTEGVADLLLSGLEKEMFAAEVTLGHL